MRVTFIERNLSQQPLKTSHQHGSNDLYAWPPVWHDYDERFLVVYNQTKYRGRKSKGKGQLDDWQLVPPPLPPPPLPIEAPFGSLIPRPHLRERVWWHLADSSGFIKVDYFLERDFSPPITLQKRQSVVQHRKSLATSAWWHSTFFGT